MAVNPDEDTEFNDALRAHGILPPKPVRERTPSPPPARSKWDDASELTSAELDRLDEDAADSDEERLVASYKRLRMKELRKEDRRGFRGDVKPISREDFVREVTEASKAAESDEEEKHEGDGWKGTGVVCFLYNEAAASKRLASQLAILAKRYPRTKFVSIVGSKCIENYPDRHLPTLFLYRNGGVKRQFIAYGADKERPVEELEVLLMATNMIDPRKASKTDAEIRRRNQVPDEATPNDKDAEDAEEEDEDEFGDPPPPVSNARNGTRTGTGMVNARSGGIRTGTVGRAQGSDEDSDFDL